LTILLPLYCWLIYPDPNGAASCEITFQNYTDLAPQHNRKHV